MRGHSGHDEIEMYLDVRNKILPNRLLSRRNVMNPIANSRILEVAMLSNKQNRNSSEKRAKHLHDKVNDKTK